MFRVQTEESAQFGAIVAQLLPQLPPIEGELSIGKQPQGPFATAAEWSAHTPQDQGFRNGEMLYLQYSGADQASIGGSSSSSQGKNTGSVAIQTGSTGVNNKPADANELPVDKQLQSEEGLIPRQRSNFCKHNEKGMCEYCSPLPPWDKEYLTSNNIKHESFHAHLKRLDELTNKGQGSSYVHPLTPSNFKIDKNCKNGHDPWPRGICSKCQPSAITLQQQDFRMVDHLEFADSNIVNSFIESWRSSGLQRIGIMYGTYQKYDKVPLGIKGVVEAIYEPVQTDENDGLTFDLEEWEKQEQKIDAIAAKCGLCKVGVIFTDLTDSGEGGGTVLAKRHKDSYFLTNLEVLLAAKLQKKYPNYTHHSSTGKFSSKFTTCVISGNLSNEIDLFAYQVSESAEALTEATIISGSTKPSFAYINETNSDRYVPDIFYTKFNEYNLQVKTNAKPAFPVDYLLVSLTHGFPTEPTPLFKSTSFPIEHRAALGVAQDLSSLSKIIPRDSFNTGALITALSDFHLLLFLKELGVLNEQEFSVVIDIAVKHDAESCYKLLELPGWQTLLAIMNSS